MKSIKWVIWCDYACSSTNESDEKKENTKENKKKIDEKRMKILKQLSLIMPPERIIL